MTAINLAHAAAKLGPFRGGSDAFGSEKGHSTALVRFNCVVSDEIERHVPVADAASLGARGVENRAATDDSLAREGFGDGVVGWTD